MEVWFVAIFATVVGYGLFADIQNRRERTKLLNRIMARDYKEFEYFDKKFKSDVDEEVNLRKETRQMIAETDASSEAATPPEVKKFLSEVEEDWTESDLDLQKLPKLD